MNDPVSELVEFIDRMAANHMYVENGDIYMPRRMWEQLSPEQRLRAESLGFQLADD